MPSPDTTRGAHSNVRPPIRIPSILFSSTLRLFCLRCILVAGTLLMASQIYWKVVPGSLVFGVIVLHHLLRFAQIIPLNGLAYLTAF